MTARLVPAAEELLAQVKVLKPRATWLVGEPDGFNRVRSLRFDRKTSKWLDPLLQAASDTRVHSTGDDDGRLWVNFVPDARADLRTPFPLAQAAAVLYGKSGQDGGGPSSSSDEDD